MLDSAPYPQVLVADWRPAWDLLVIKHGSLKDVDQLPCEPLTVLWDQSVFHSNCKRALKNIQSDLMNLTEGETSLLNQQKTVFLTGLKLPVTNF